MPKKKKEVKKISEKPVEKEEMKKVEKVVAEEPKSSLFPEYEGATVMEVSKDRETPTHFHCVMSDGTTKHVPKDLF